MLLDGDETVVLKFVVINIIEVRGLFSFEHNDPDSYGFGFSFLYCPLLSCFAQ